MIVGTTPVPVDGESADTLGLTAEAEIKAALHARLRHQGKPASPAQIEVAYQALRRTREVRENLESLRQTGATVAYAEADVRDPAALARVLEDWRGRHGDVAGLIHGAGLIKDKLIRQKSVESFDRVLETKLDGALNLIRLVRGDSLKFTALFSSIAGRFGNVGPVGLRRRQRDLKQAGPLAGPALARPGGLTHLGSVVRCGHGLATREPSRQPWPRHDLARVRRLATIERAALWT